MILRKKSAADTFQAREGPSPLFSIKCSSVKIEIKREILHQLRGRSTTWIVAFVISSVIVAADFFAFRPTCDLMFHPAGVARNYAIAWFCLFVFIGVTNKGKVVFALIVILWLGTKPMIEYRIPNNEYGTVLWLNDMQKKLWSANTPAKELSDIIGSDLGKTGRLTGYQFEYLPEAQRTALKHYVIMARPQSYCVTGQKSFTLDDSGSIHYTPENRAATLNDPLLRTNDKY